MTTPDMPRYDAAVAELAELGDDGRLTKDDFRRLWRQAETALEGSGLDGMEAFYSYADAEDWIPT